MLPIGFVVIVRTMRLFAAVTMETRFHFEIVRMEFLFFPAVAVGAFVLKWAAILIRGDKVFSMPIVAHLF